MVKLEDVVRHTPAQIYDPGTMSAYSNYGTTLLGYLVQWISGEPYPHYVERHILRPLGMNRSSAAQPLPERLVPQMAGGFKDPSFSRDPQPFEVISDAPAGTGFVATLEGKEIR